MKTVRPSKCFPDDKKNDCRHQVDGVVGRGKNNGEETDGYTKLNEKQAEIKMHAHTRTHTRTCVSEGAISLMFGGKTRVSINIFYGLKVSER